MDASGVFFSRPLGQAHRGPQAALTYPLRIGQIIALWLPALDELLVTALGFYATGWFVNEGESGFFYVEGGWTGGLSIYHCGACGGNGSSAVVRILPNRGIAYVAFADASSASSLDAAGNEIFALLGAIIDNLHDDPDFQNIGSGGGNGA